jgi:hypothetical protein
MNAYKILITMQQQLIVADSTKNIFTRPEWLRHSVGWTLACVAGWFMLIATLGKLFGTYGDWFSKTLLGATAAAHLLIWCKAVWSARLTVAASTEPLWLSIASACWLLGLILFQLVCLFLLFLFLVIGANGGIMG